MNDYVWMIFSVLIFCFVAWVLREWISVYVAKTTEDGRAVREVRIFSLRTEISKTFMRVASNLSRKELVALSKISEKGVVPKGDKYDLGEAAVRLVVNEFKYLGVDVEKELGKDYLLSELRYAVDKLNQQ